MSILEGMTNEQLGTWIFYYLLVLQYVFLLCITAYCLRQVIKKKNRAKWQLLFIVFFTFACLGRIVSFALEPVFTHGGTEPMGTFNFFLIFESVPSVCFITCYLILLYVLAETYYHPIRITNFGNKGVSSRSLIVFFLCLLFCF